MMLKWPEWWEGTVRRSGTSMFQAEGTEPVFKNPVLTLEPWTLAWSHSSLSPATVPAILNFPFSQLHAFALFPLSIVSSSSSLGEITLQNPAKRSYMTQLPTLTPALTPPDSSSSKSWCFSHHCFLYTVSNSNTAHVNVDCNWFV